MYIDSPYLQVGTRRDLIPPNTCMQLTGRASRMDSRVFLKSHMAKHAKAIPGHVQKDFCMSAVLPVSIVEICKVLGCMLAGENVW